MCRQTIFRRICNLESSSKNQCLPDSTYRFQFSKTFRVRDAEELLPYLSRLGISHVYSSPLLKARRNSTHGYDVTSHTALNDEICSRKDLESFSRKLYEAKMGIILDYVPNHMATDNENAIWQSVLKDGRQSPYAGFFDIDWEKTIQGQKNKIALPILTESLDRVIRGGKLVLNFEPSREDPFSLKVGKIILPISRSGSTLLVSLVEDNFEKKYGTNVNGKKGSSILLSRFTAVQRENDFGSIRETVREFNQSPDRLQDLLQLQNYVLIPWSDPKNQINYRRFFNINDLIAIKIENYPVFQEAHLLIFDLLRRGIIQGLRIDHPDGLSNPTRYFSDLQLHSLEELFLSPQTSGVHVSTHIYVIAEKILNPSEELPRDWEVYGTTGYDFANDVNGIFVRSKHNREFDRIYRAFTGETRSYADIAFESKMLILKRFMRPDLDRLVRIAIEKSREVSEFSTVDYSSLSDAIETCVACFPVYRSYVNNADHISNRDRLWLKQSLKEAKRRNNKLQENSMDLLRTLFFNNSAFGPE